MEQLGRHGMQTDFVRLDAHRCKACWKCLEKCPEVIGKVGFLWHRHVVIYKADECIGCFRCVKLCPTGAFSRIESKG
ncbi:MAG: 4Fe-4S dicluster domain-containing protein [Bacteroidales bacterium]|jgi:2-oxoglutarate ferredoxin oxidoreductase subunit delta|nr:4Fe-4S dicluster domain-containing protein [Bacteroidales bacterium]